VRDTQGLEEAHGRLYDGAHVALPHRNGWLWHVTCVRESRGRDKKALTEAARQLRINDDWTLNTISYMELGADGRYEAIATWEME
jgi:hypothetical protein